MGGVDDEVRDGGIGSDCSCVEKADLALDLVSDSYSEMEKISVDDSRYSSCPAYTIY